MLVTHKLPGKGERWWFWQLRDSVTSPDFCLARSTDKEEEVKKGLNSAAISASHRTEGLARALRCVDQSVQASNVSAASHRLLSVARRNPGESRSQGIAGPT